MKNSMVLILFLLGIFSGCTTLPSSENETPSNELSKEELEENTNELIRKVLSPEDLNLELNHGEKWQIDTVTYQKFMQIKQQVYVFSGKMESYTLESYHMLGAEILDFLHTIPKSHGEEQEAVNKVLDLTQNQCAVLLEGDVHLAQVAVINLSVIFDAFPDYYLPSPQ